MPLTVAELESKMAAAADAWEQFSESIGERDLTDDEQKTYDGHKGAFESAKRALERAQEVQRAKAAKAVPLDEQGRKSVPAVPAEPEHPMRTLAQIVMVGTAVKQGGGNPAEIAAKHFGEGAAVTRAMNASSDSAGGIFVPVQQSTEIIEYLRPMSVVLGSGARVVPLPNGNLTIPKLASGASSAYLGEGSAITNTSQTIGDLKLTGKILATVLPISNRLLRLGTPGVEAFLVADLEASMVAAGDAAFLRSVGSENSPRGLRYQAAGANVIAANGTVNLTNVTTDLGKAELALQSADIPMLQCGYLMAPRSWSYLYNLRDSNGNLAFPELKDKMLRGYPVKVSTRIPVNLGGGANESEVYFVDFAQVLIGQALGMQVETFPNGTYEVSGGLRSGISRDETAVRILQEHDLAVRHPAAVAVLTGVTWGA